MALSNVHLCQRGHAWAPENIGKAGIRRYCRACRRIREQLRPHPVSSEYKAILKERNRQRRITRQELIRRLKSAPCADCGLTYPYYVMDFDHVRGEKKFLIAQRRSGASSDVKFMAEIEKCDVVCSNCHRIRTYVRYQDKHSQGAREGLVAHSRNAEAGLQLVEATPRIGLETGGS